MRRRERLDWFRCDPAEFDSPAWREARGSARAAVWELLLYYWRNECRPLPASAKSLSKVVLLSQKVIRSSQPVIGHYFATNGNGYLICPMLDKEREVGVKASDAARARREGLKKNPPLELPPKGGATDVTGTCTTERNGTETPPPREILRNESETDSTSAEAVTQRGNGPLAPTVRILQRDGFGTKPRLMTREEIEAYSREWFYEIFPHGDSGTTWELEKDSIMSVVERCGRAHCDLARRWYQEDVRANKRILNRVAWSLAYANGSWYQFNEMNGIQVDPKYKWKVGKK